jgi:hypothetical protein
VYPIVRGVPVLINEQASLFDIATIVRETEQPPTAAERGWHLHELLPPLSHNHKAERNFAEFHDRLGHAGSIRILVVGSGILGAGMRALVDDPKLTVVESDVFVGPRTSLVCDAHDLPFEDASFDGVVIQGVLSCVHDPQRCVANIHRVLKPGGLVYAEVAFVQQVVMGRFDFQRFTHIGLLRLFNRFDELGSGVQCGPGMALAWSWTFFLRSLVRSQWGRRLMHGFGVLTSFWLSLLDHWLVDRPAAYDAASAVYFLGARSERTRTDREISASYVGRS